MKDSTFSVSSVLVGREWRTQRIDGKIMLYLSEIQRCRRGIPRLTGVSIWIQSCCRFVLYEPESYSPTHSKNCISQERFRPDWTWFLHIVTLSGEKPRWTCLSIRKKIKQPPNSLLQLEFIWGFHLTKSSVTFHQTPLMDLFLPSKELIRMM